MEAWLKMPRRELDELYCAAEARTPPRGTTHGTVIAGWPEIAYGAAVMASALWRGKVFDYSMTETEGLVINRLTPFGFHCVIGKFYRGDSWLDRKKSIIIDYSKTSLIARNIRDELREVQPGVFLGKVWWHRTRLFDFALVPWG